MRLAVDKPVVTLAVILAVLGGGTFAAGLDRDLTPFVLVLVIPLSAVIAAWIGGGWEMVRGLFARIVRWRVAPRWYLVALGIPLLGTLLIDAAGIVSGQATLDQVVGGLEASAIAVPLVVLLPALFEEFAWRGFGVEVLTRGGHGFVGAALGIGVIFTAIHLPLYLPGQLYENLPMWPAVLTLMGYAVLLTWIYLGSGRSSLLAGICHAALNGLVPLTHGLNEVWVWEARGVVFALIGLAVLATVLASRSAERT